MRNRPPRPRGGRVPALGEGSLGNRPPHPTGGHISALGNRSLGYRPPHPRAGCISAPGEGSLCTRPPCPTAGCISAPGEGSLCTRPPCPRGGCISAPGEGSLGPRPPRPRGGHISAPGEGSPAAPPQRWAHLSAGRGVPGRPAPEILIPAIHIQATGRQGCCGNRCGMFLSILFALVGVAGSVYAVSVSALGLVNGPLCQVQEANGSLSTWAQPFRSTHEELSEQSYLFNTSTWDACVNPPGVIRFNVILFSLVLVAALMELLLCRVQVLNGLFGCLCGTCNKKQDRGPKVRPHSRAGPAPHPRASRISAPATDPCTNSPCPTP
ncbi:uncharacterized protein LOC127039785 isoform X2 [Gopherus flavomarginatus]|uniref:uncharacterized protein LOC127039785 isoform X1 n=1 Tax=Gopherus flavomarginatus TaxID=286002 RepID=UPI0021CC1879|nr:uncharacterized protein LOC127039785 isoform X1 [Gopherus flavomarginatus]XP_050789604.1 uncharacterized protein LOC127039785 isoform X2 [Gopherus flavomarginatus]